MYITRDKSRWSWTYSVVRPNCSIKLHSKAAEICVTPINRINSETRVTHSSILIFPTWSRFNIQMIIMHGWRFSTYVFIVVDFFLLQIDDISLNTTHHTHTTHTPLIFNGSFFTNASKQVVLGDFLCWLLFFSGVCVCVCWGDRGQNISTTKRLLFYFDFSVFRRTSSSFYFAI